MNRIIILSVILFVSLVNCEDAENKDVEGRGKAKYALLSKYYLDNMAFYIQNMLLKNSIQSRRLNKNICFKK